MPAADASLSLLLERLSLRVHLSQADKDAVLALPQSVRSLRPAEYLTRVGDVPTHCCLMVSGFTARWKLVAGGGRQILAVNMKGDIVDLQNLLLDRSDHNVQALTDAKVVIIPRAALEALAFASPSVGRALWLETLVDASILREWIVNIGRRDARTRVAHLLCEFAVRLEAAGLAASTAYELPITQGELADILGLTAVHMNRMLK
jgi:CRP-like cAMP-binding protein